MRWKPLLALLLLTVLSACATPPASRDVTITQTARGVEIRSSDIILFDSGKADIKPAGQAFLDRVASILTRRTHQPVSIEGHTDNLPVGNNERFRSNWDLSAARAGAVADFLLARGRIDSSRLSVSGYADTRPVESNANPAGRARNRRIEISINLP